MRRLAIALAVLILGGCATTTLIEGQWKAADSELRPYGSVAVLTINDKPIKRQEFGTSLSQMLTKRGIRAAAGASFLPRDIYDKDGDGRLDKDIDIEAVRKAVVDAGYEAVLTVTVLNTAKDRSYVRPRETRVDILEFDRFNRYWVKTTEIAYTPGYYQQTTRVQIETNLYDARDLKLDWTGHSVTMDPSDATDLAMSYARKITDVLINEGMLKPSNRSRK
ncbi:MAG: hypothetical protein ABIE42_04935 [Candidatus Eisenbacteria bacterium]